MGVHFCRPNRYIVPRHQTDDYMMSPVKLPGLILLSFRTLAIPSPQYACTCSNNCLFDDAKRC